MNSSLPSVATMPAHETLGLLARVLEYPDTDTAGVREELVEHLEAWRPEAAELLRQHIKALGDMSLYAQQERYAATFDVNPAVCLYVGYHLFGDSYPRGVFMARLAGEYRKIGFDYECELPDNVPIVLRYLAREDAVDAVELVDDAMVPALRKIVAAFAETTNPYGALLEAILCTFERPENAEVLDESARAGKRRTLALPVFSNKDERAFKPSPEAAAMIASRPRNGAKS